METIEEQEQGQEQAPQFDTSATFRKRNMRTESEGLTEVAMTWPSDELWIKRSKQRKVLTRMLGRGQNEPDVEPGDADLEVYKATRTEGSPDLTAAEATLLVNFIAEARVLSVELGSTEAVLKFHLLRAIEVTHRIKIPTAKQAKECSKAMDKFIGLPHNVYSNTMNLQATAKLYDQLSPQVEGYAGDVVPIIHKDTVIREVFQALEREIAEGSDEKGF